MARKKVTAQPLSDEELLRTWNALNGVLITLPEERVANLLKLEQRQQNRKWLIVRLHQRLTKLRMKRERAELSV